MYACAQVTEELQQVSEEKVLLENTITDITHELAEKTPALQQLRREHDQVLTNCNQLTNKLNSLFEECESLRLESDESMRQAKATDRENARLKELAGDLGRQVKVHMMYNIISYKKNMQMKKREFASFFFPY